VRVPALWAGEALTGAGFDSYRLLRVLDTRAGNNTRDHDDTQVDTQIDRLQGG
jgi:hypothetical protein